MHGQLDSRIYNIMTIRNIDAKFKEVSSFFREQISKICISKVAYCTNVHLHHF